MVLCSCFPHFLSSLGDIWYMKSACHAVDNFWVSWKLGKPNFSNEHKWNYIYTYFETVEHFESEEHHGKVCIWWCGVSLAVLFVVIQLVMHIDKALLEIIYTSLQPMKPLAVAMMYINSRFIVLLKPFKDQVNNFLTLCVAHTNVLHID